LPEIAGFEGKIPQISESCADIQMVGIDGTQRTSVYQRRTKMKTVC
jgi:hypothetical protein